MTPLLETRELTVYFGGIDAVKDVSIHVDRGTIFGLIGPNGAGKTTLVNAVSGFLRPNYGAVFFEGRDVTGVSADRLAGLGVARTFQNLRLFPNRTVHENVAIGAYLCGRSGMMSGLLRLPRARHDELVLAGMALDAIAMVGLTEKADKEVGVLGTGEQRLVAVARSLARAPTLLLLDEPAAGLNETESRRLSEALCLLPEKGITLVVIEHDLAMVMAISDRIAVLNEGSVLAVGSPTEVRHNPSVIAAYVGAD